MCQWCFQLTPTKKWRDHGPSASPRRRRPCEACYNLFCVILIAFNFYLFQTGEYSNGTSCVPCPKGTYCPALTANPVPCRSGTYATATGSTFCQLCPAGFACQNASNAPVPCSAGFYSPAGQIVCQVRLLTFVFTS